MNINMTPEEREYFIKGHKALEEAYRTRTSISCPICEGHMCIECSYEKIIGIDCTDLASKQGTKSTCMGIIYDGIEEHLAFRMRFHQAMVKSLEEDNPSYAIEVLKELNQKK